MAHSMYLDSVCYSRNPSHNLCQLKNTPLNKLKKVNEVNDGQALPICPPLLSSIIKVHAQ